MGVRKGQVADAAFLKHMKPSEGWLAPGRRLLPRGPGPTSLSVSRKSLGYTSCGGQSTVMTGHMQCWVSPIFAGSDACPFPPLAHCRPSFSPLCSPDLPRPLSAQGHPILALPSPAHAWASCPTPCLHPLPLRPLAQTGWASLLRHPNGRSIPTASGGGGLLSWLEPSQGPATSGTPPHAAGGS